MQKRAGFVIVFFVFLLLSISIFLIFRNTLQTPLYNSISAVISPIQKSFYSTFGGAFTKASNAKHLSEENRKLAKQIVNQNELRKEAQALRDQYDSETFPSHELIPVKVIGMQSFIPGIAMPEEIIIDHGSVHGIKEGETVILHDSLVGTVRSVTEKRSLVTLVTNKAQSFPAYASKTNALGIIRGKGNGVVVFENIVLADILEKGDIVVTKGNETLEGSGYPPGLLVGKITSVDKKASNLFQSAEIESLVDFAKLDTVFIIKNE